jgi:hypothetical protein
MKREVPELKFFPKENRETIRKLHSELSDEDWNNTIQFYESINQSFEGKAKSAVATFDQGFILGVEYSIKYLQVILETTKKEAKERLETEDLTKVVLDESQQ